MALLTLLALALLPASSPAVTFTEIPVPGMVNQAGIITVGPDGALWFTMPDTNRIGRITTAGAISQFTPPTGAPLGIAPGPDGALWFTEGRANKIGRITTAGAVTEFAVPSFDSGPRGIVAGPDGALWFTEYQGKIGRITTAGAITEYAVPNGYGLGSIATGPDGALWFTANRGIGRITTAGAITVFPAPSANNQSQIVQGPDGALWYTGFNDDKIGRITTAGAITEFPVLGPNRYPSGITVGPDGALWFTEKYGFARITTAGAVSEYGTPSGALVGGGIVSGPDDALWGSSTSQIVRATPGDAGLPAPALGKTVNVAPASGKVFVSVPAGSAFASLAVPGIKGRTFVPLTAARQIPVGSLLDTRRGSLSLTSASTKAGEVFSGTFSAGVFAALQARSGLTDLTLKGSSFRACATGKKASVALSRRAIRRLRANARGRFRTRGRYSAATVRGTVWDTIDRCDGTLTKVKRGVVVVRDNRKHRNITVRAGKSYLAKAG